MFSLSTSWNSKRFQTGLEIVNSAKELGFDTLELNFTLTEDKVNDIIELRHQGKIQISSLHNYCPLPHGLTVETASPDHYALSSLDEAVRREGVSLTKRTIDYAAKAEALAVVLHAGKVEMEHTSRYLVQLYKEGKAQESEFMSYRDQMVKERTAKSAPHLAKTVESLKELAPYAAKRGILLGIETRYYYQEIPGFDEFEKIFSQLDPPDLFYWHDIGHAQVIETLGLGQHEPLLRQQAKRLLGMHIHDIEGTDDHRAPLSGKFSFERIVPYVTSRTIQVIELRASASPDAIGRGISYLENLLGDRVWSGENEIFQSREK